MQCAPDKASPPKMWWWLIVVLVALAAQACAVHRIATLSPNEAARDLEVGEGVIVGLKDGKKEKGFVKEITNGDLATDHGRYAWKDISYVSHWADDPVRSAAATIGTYWLVGLISILLFTAMF